MLNFIQSQTLTPKNIINTKYLNVTIFSPLYFGG